MSTSPLPGCNSRQGLLPFQLQCRSACQLCSVLHRALRWLARAAVFRHVETIEILIKRETVSVHRDVKTNWGVASLVRGQTVTDLHGYSAPISIW